MEELKRLNNITELLFELKRQGVPESDYLKHVSNYIEAKARHSNIPIHGNFELTPLCNLNCKMCYVHLEDSKFNANKLLTYEQWCFLIKSAYNLGMRTISFTGGECFTYPSFDSLYKFAACTLKLRVNILSNGLLINQERIELFKKYPPNKIQISLYGSSNDAYEKVCGVRAFDIVYKNIALLRDANIPVSITLTPNAFMREDMKPLVHTAASLNVKFNINAQLFPPRSETGRTKKDLPIDDYIEMYKTVFEINQEYLIPVDSTELPDENHHGRKQFGLSCGAGRSSFGIRYDGNICPCLSLAELAVNPFEIGFTNAWQKVNEYAKQYKLPEECVDCIYVSKCPSCVALHKGAPVQGHRDPIICERTKKLITAGLVSLPKMVVPK